MIPAMVFIVAMVWITPATTATAAGEDAPGGGQQSDRT